VHELSPCSFSLWQTNPESLKGRGVMAIFAEEGMALYKYVHFYALINHALVRFTLTQSCCLVVRVHHV
jgi:hypothetical protein